MRGNFPIYSLNQGEVSKIALQRVDIAKMRIAAGCQLNWMPRVVGPMSLRPGMPYVGEILGDQACAIVPFVFSKRDTAQLELTPFTMRVRVADALVMRVAVATQVQDPTFQGTGGWLTTGTTSGAAATISGGLTLTGTPVGGLAQVKQDIAVATADYGKEHGLRFVVTNGPVIVRAGSSDGATDLIRQTSLDTGTHSIACTPTSDIFVQIESADPWNKTLSSVAIDNPASGAAVPLMLPTPWGAGDLANVRYDSSGDIIYTACYGLQQYKVERRSTNSWSVVLYRSSDGPFQENPGIEANFTPGAYYGNTTLTSDRPWFDPLHVGCLFRLFSNGMFNQAVLGAQNAFSAPVRVTGVGTVARNYAWTVAGTYAGVLTLQRSFDGPDSGFTDVASSINGFTGSVASNTGTGSTPVLDNIIAWERIGFKAGAYTSGNATVVSSYVGGGGFGICRVTGYVSKTVVNIEVLQNFPSLQATTDWLESDWSNLVGYPTSVCFHDGRLGFYGRDEIWLSRANLYDSFAKLDLNGDSLGDAAAINFAMGYGPFDVIPWALSLTRLLIGREQSIASARSSNFDQPLTPTDIAVRDCSDQGAMTLPAVKVGKRGIFVQQNGNKVYELGFNAQEMDYDDRDLTRLNTDIGSKGFVGIGKSTQPDKIIWLPRGDGQCAALLYDVKDEVEAWWRTQTLGVIENYSTLPSTANEDAQYFVVRRTINGTTRRFLERSARRDQCLGGSLNYHADCALAYSGAAVTTLQISWLPLTSIIVWADGKPIGNVTTDASGNFTMPDGNAHSNVIAGLGGKMLIGSHQPVLRGSGVPDHLFAAETSATLNVGSAYNGYPCEIWADIGGNGRIKHIGPLVVTNGVVTLPNSQIASTIIGFLGFIGVFESAKLAYAADDGVAIGKKKKIDHVGLPLFDSYSTGLLVGQRPDKLDDMPSMVAGMAPPAGTVWNELDEPSVPVPGEWTPDARVFIVAQAPYPAMVAGIVVSMTTNDK